MFDQWQEELDYDPRSEFENALHISRMEWHNKNAAQNAKIQQLIEDGRFVVILTHPVYCPRTDAIMGEDKILIGDYPVYADALRRAEEENEKLCGEESLVILPREDSRPIEHVSSTDDEIPF
jgi:hypothetical protein